MMRINDVQAAAQTSSQVQSATDRHVHCGMLEWPARI